MDPAKLKVVELRAELSKRGLDTKGNKPVLVERLRKALEELGDDGNEQENDVELESEDERVATSGGAKDSPQKMPVAEPTTPSGRTSRSSTSLSPRKSSPARAIPKVVLSPLPEKHAALVKPATVEPEKTNAGVDEAVTVAQTAAAAVAVETQAASEPVEKTPVEEPSDPIERVSEDKVSEDKDDADSGDKTASAPEPVDETRITEPPDESAEAPRKEPSNEEKEEEKPKEAIEASLPEAIDPKEKEVLEAQPEDKTIEERLGEEPEVGLGDEGPGETKEKIIEDKEAQKSQETTEADETMEVKEQSEVAQSIEEKVEPMDQSAVDTPALSESVKTEVSEPPTETIDEKPVDLPVQKKDALEKAQTTEDVAPPVAPETEKKEVIKMEVEPAVEPAVEPVIEEKKDRKRKRSASPEEEKPSVAVSGRRCDEPDLKEAEVVLSWYDSDLNLVIDKESLVSATAMHDEGFGYIWAGARASYGFTDGKVYYEAKITEYCEVNLQGEQSPHVLRAGWSVQGTSMQLGEEPLTYGYGGTGKISSANKFSDYGQPFGKGDIIGCYLDTSHDSKVTISYTLNGKSLGNAFTIKKEQLAGKALYPHVLTKNCTFSCNFGQEAPWSERILEGYTPVGAVQPKDRVHGPRRPETLEDCEMIMMCGLPSAGKTFWATNYALANPDKLYNILGTNNLIEKMKVIGLPRRRNYPGRWEALIEACTRCLNKLLELASTRRRNYILDQTNVYPSAQRRKMRNFSGYKRRAVVIVPTEEEMKLRAAKRNASEGDIAPESAVLEMKANFSAPVVGESFDSVEYIELPAEEAKKMIEKYNKEGKDAGYGQQATKRPRFEKVDNSHRDSRDARPPNRDTRDSRDSRDHRDRRSASNYTERNRPPTWRGVSGGSSSSGGGGGGSGSWNNRQGSRPVGGHARHGSGNGGGSGYGGSQGSGGWRGGGRIGGGGGMATHAVSSYRSSSDRRGVGGHDRRNTSVNDRSRSSSSRTGGSWAPANSYQGSQQQQSGNWGGGSWQGNQQQQGSWSSQSSSSGWGNQQPQQQQQQQWGNWKSYSSQPGNYGQSSYGQQGYGNGGNWGSWNQQYYNQYWGQQQPSGQSSSTGSQATSSSSGGGATSANSTSTSSPYNNYSSGWQGYAQSYGYSTDSNSNAHQQK